MNAIFVMIIINIINIINNVLQFLYIDNINKHHRYLFAVKIFGLGEFTPEECLFLVSIHPARKGPNTTQTQTLKQMKIQTIKNLAHQEKKFQFLIRIQHCNEEIILINFQHTF